MVNIVHQWLFTALLGLLHPFFVSVIDINHNQQDKTLEISVRIFTDDLEKTLQQYGKTKVDLLHPTDKKATEALLSAYLNKQLQFAADGKAIKWQLLGFEQIKESTWCYLEVENFSGFNSMDIRCELLYDYEKNQINIFHVKNKGKEKSYKLEYPKSTVRFDF